MSPRPAALRLLDVTARPSPAGPVVLRGVSVTVACGTVRAVLGAPGSGKTTLLRCAAGLLVPAAGQVRGPAAWGAVAYASPRRLSSGFLTVAETLAAVRAGRDVPPARVAAVAARCGLGAVAGVRTAFLDDDARLRLAVAQALVAAPEVLCLDDVPAGVRDVEWLAALAADGPSVLAAVTDRDVAAALDPAAPVLRDGRLHPGAAGATAAVLELELGDRRTVLRVPLAGTTPEAVLAECRARALPVHRSRVVPLPFG